jgi:hypothetical protein
MQAISMENRNQLLAIGRKTLGEEELPEILTTIPEPKKETTDDEQQQEDNQNTAEIAKRIEKIRSKYDTNDINISMDQPWETMEENAKTMKEIITKMRNTLKRILAKDKQQRLIYHAKTGRTGNIAAMLNPKNRSQPEAHPFIHDDTGRTQRNHGGAKQEETNSQAQNEDTQTKYKGQTKEKRKTADGGHQ